jgi:hypothetical protein
MDVIRITEIAVGKVPAWPHPVDLRYIVEEGQNLGRRGVTTLDDVCTWILLDDLLAYWDGIQWAEVHEETAAGMYVAMRFARVSGYGELNPSITLLVPRDQRRIVEEHHKRWQRSKDQGSTL